MVIIKINFSRISFEINVEDSIIADKIFNIFPADNTIKKSDFKRIYVKGNRMLGYEIYCENKRYGHTESIDKAVALIVEVIENSLLSLIDKDTCIIHGSTVEKNRCGVVFTGISGSGKTSLSLQFSKYGKLLGDEYTFLDLNTNKVWQEQMPLQFKDGNSLIKEKVLNLNSLVPATRNGKEKIYYHSLNSLGKQDDSAGEDTMLAFIVFPKYIKNHNRVNIRKAELKELPEKILNSVISIYEPSRLFAKLLKLSSKNRIKFIEVIYSDGLIASKKLNEYIEQAIKERENEYEL